MKNLREGKGKKGQTSMILIVLIIIIFMAVGIFLVISSIKPQHNDYYNLYAHNLLLSVLRKNTGLGGQCDTYGSTIACASTTDYKECGGTTCRNLSHHIVPSLIDTIIDTKPSLEYCLVVEPENWTVTGGDRLVYPSEAKCDIVQSRDQRWTANEKILQRGANIDIKMIISGY